MHMPPTITTLKGFVASFNREPVRQLAALAADVRLPVGAIILLFISLATEVILLAVRLTSHEDYFLPRAQLGHHLALFRQEFVNVREHHAAARPVQQRAQMLAPAGLHWCLAEDVRAALELAEKLVVEISAKWHRLLLP